MREISIDLFASDNIVYSCICMISMYTININYLVLDCDKHEFTPGKRKCSLVKKNDYLLYNSTKVIDAWFRILLLAIRK